MGRFLQWSVIFGKWFFFSAVVALPIFMFMRGNDRSASTIAVVLVGFITGILAGSPTVQHARDGLTAASHSVISKIFWPVGGGVVGEGANVAADKFVRHSGTFEDVKESLIPIVDVASKAQFGNHWIFVALVGGAWGLLVTLNAESGAKPNKNYLLPP